MRQRKKKLGGGGDKNKCLVFQFGHIDNHTVITYSQPLSSTDIKGQRQNALHPLGDLWSSDILGLENISVLASSFPPASWRRKSQGEVWKGLLCRSPTQGPRPEKQPLTRRPPLARPSQVTVLFQVVNESCQTKSHFKSTLC